MTSPSQSKPKKFTESELYHKWYNSVASGDPNDYIIALTAHPGYTGTSGTGKTTLAGSLAKNYFHFSDTPFSADVHYTLDVGELAYEIMPSTDEGACLIGDEMQGTVATTNLNSKRSQKTEALDAYAAIAGGRKNRKTVILVFQTLARVNKDLFDFVDSWLLIVDDVNYRANHYAIVPEVFNMESSKLKTPRVETLTWDPLPDGDPDYEIMERKKDRANEGKREHVEDDEDSDAVQDTLSVEARNKLIRERAAAGVPNSTLADAFDLSPGRISQIINE